MLGCPCQESAGAVNLEIVWIDAEDPETNWPSLGIPSAPPTLPVSVLVGRNDGVGGRTFLAIGHIAHHRREWDNMNRLIARNGYSGTVLWQREFPERYLVHRSAFIATEETF